MDEIVRQLIIRIGWSVFPATLFLVFSQNPILKPSPSPTPTPTATVSPSPSLTPTSTETPTSTPTPEPQPKADPPLAETNTPTPSPLPTPSTLPTGGPVTSEQLDEWFTTYSNHYSIDRQKLWKVAVCESNLRPNARNGDYGGLFQFSTNSWKTTRRAMNMDPNPELRFHPEEAIRTAAFKMSTVGLSAWPNCGK